MCLKLFNPIHIHVHYTYSKQFGKYWDNLTGAAVSIILFFALMTCLKKMTNLSEELL